jgi:hypothetical protein
MPGLYNIFTIYLRYLYGSFMTAVAMPHTLSAVYESGDVRLRYATLSHLTPRLRFWQARQPGHSTKEKIWISGSSFQSRTMAG